MFFSELARENTKRLLIIELEASIKEEQEKPDSDLLAGLLAAKDIIQAYETD